jgi:aromatic ring-opening dioxygenase catalytic subunit (LigB family)
VGSPELAMRTKELLEAKGIKCAVNDKRGYDHGVFVPLLLTYPQPKVPGTLGCLTQYTFANNYPHLYHYCH